MDSIDDIFNGIKIGMLERLYGPLTFALLVSWSIFNYEVFVIIFTDGVAADKLKLIRTEIFPNELKILTDGILYPIAAAAAYVFIFPIFAGLALFASTQYQNLNRWITDGKLLSRKMSMDMKNEFVDVKQKYEEKLLKSDEDLDRTKALMLKDVSDKEIKHKDVISKLNSKIKVLNSELANVRNEKVNSENANSEINEESVIHFIENEDAQNLSDKMKLVLTRYYLNAKASTNSASNNDDALIKEAYSVKLNRLDTKARSILNLISDKGNYISVDDVLALNEPLGLDNKSMAQTLAKLKEEGLIIPKVIHDVTFFTISNELKRAKLLDNESTDAA